MKHVLCVNISALLPKKEDVWISDSDDATGRINGKRKNAEQFSWIWTERSCTDEKELFLPATVRRSKRLFAAGHHIVISTGRPLASAIMQAKRTPVLRKGLFVISFNGGEIYDITAKSISKTACNAARSPHF